MGTVSPNFSELYDWLKENRQDILERCKDQARLQRCTLGSIITWKEDAIREMMGNRPLSRQRRVSDG